MPLEDQPSVDPRLRRQFDYYRKRLASKGVLAGTRHKRITIDKDRMSLKRLQQLGFVPVSIAVPEAGQDQLTSYRHPDNNFHIHSHPGVWTMHEDEHPAATMIMKSRPTLLGKAMALAEGVPHAITEGVPGAAIYLKNQAMGLLPNVEAPDMLQAIFRDRQEAKNPQTKSAGFRVPAGVLMGLRAGTLGAGVGAAVSEEGNRLRGALTGAGLGLGATAGLFAPTLPLPQQAVLRELVDWAPVALGGAGGAMLGRGLGAALQGTQAKEAYELGVQEALERFKLSEATPGGPCISKPKCKGCVVCMKEPDAKPLKA